MAELLQPTGPHENYNDIPNPFEGLGPLPPELREQLLAQIEPLERRFFRRYSSEYILSIITGNETDECSRLLLPFQHQIDRLMSLRGLPIEDTIIGLLEDSYNHDPLIFGHRVRSAGLAVRAAALSSIRNKKEHYRLSDSQRTGLYEKLAAVGEGQLLHDEGKTGISADEVWNNNNPHTLRHIVGRHMHVQIGLIRAAIAGINNLSDPRQHIILEMIGTHHEKLTGNGYPNGLTKFDLEPWASIACVADICDALRGRAYSGDPRPVEEQLRIMRDEVTGVEVDKDERLLPSILMLYSDRNLFEMPIHRGREVDGFVPPSPREAFLFVHYMAYKIAHKRGGAHVDLSDYENDPLWHHLLTFRQPQEYKPSKDQRINTSRIIDFNSAAYGPIRAHLNRYKRPTRSRRAA